MLEQTRSMTDTGTGTAPVLTAGDLAGLVDQLRHVDHNAPDPELINQITELERIKSACAAAQAALTMTFVDSQTAGRTQQQQRETRAHRSINAQIALARHDSPARGNRHVGAAKALLREMPHTYQSLRTGEISEYRATLIIRETACLDVEHRRAVDRELAGTLATMGDRQTANAAARIAQRLDPGSCVKRNRKALDDRRVTIRPAPDTMTYLSALLSVAHGVAVYAALTKHAANAKATGDTRSHAQLMADELVHRITNPAAAAANAARKAAYTTTFRPAAPAPATSPGTGTATATATGQDARPAEPAAPPTASNRVPDPAPAHPAAGREDQDNGPADPAGPQPANGASTGPDSDPAPAAPHPAADTDPVDPAASESDPVTEIDDTGNTGRDETDANLKISLRADRHVRDLPSRSNARVFRRAPRRRRPMSCATGP